jgi:hypothetical protein
MSDRDRTISCGEHDKGHATYVCEHLLRGSGLGFHCGFDPEDADDPCPDAWCDACEEELDGGDDWLSAPDAAARIRLLCDRCYEVVRRRNWREDGRAFDRLVADALAYLHAQQAALQERYGVGTYDHYHWDQGTGELVFSREGRPGLVADVQFVGSTSSEIGTWLWSWANPSIDEAVRRRVREVREYGEEHGFLKLAAAHWTGGEEQAWEMTAVAALLLRARGAYRSPEHRGSTFLLITDLRWAQ